MSRSLFCRSSVLMFLFLIHLVRGDYFKLPFFDCGAAETHYDFGYCIGSHSRLQIAARWKAWTMVQNLYTWIEQNKTGKAIYESFVGNNSRRFPFYMEEAQGMAAGSSAFDFRHIFIMTCANELSYFAPSSVMQPYQPSLSCSDYVLHNYSNQQACIGHNEDNRVENLNNTFLVFSNLSDSSEVTEVGEIPFVSYGYAGEVLTQSAAWNDYIVFTSNYVHPRDVVMGGLCRNFVARAMAVQTTVDDALRMSAMDGQCSGHNYQVAAFARNDLQIVDSEVAYHALHAFTNVSRLQYWLFHANMYLHLNVSQFGSTSSLARQNTAAQLGPPADLQQILNFLGDTSNASYPMYKTGQKSDYTLHTMAINLNQGVVIIYADNPKQRTLIYECLAGKANELQSKLCCYSNM